MIQVVEHLPSKHVALSSNPKTAKKKKKRGNASNIVYKPSNTLVVEPDNHKKGLSQMNVKAKSSQSIEVQPCSSASEEHRS
jgi:hypothetical protein